MTTTTTPKPDNRPSFEEIRAVYEQDEGRLLDRSTKLRQGLRSQIFEISQQFPQQTFPELRAMFTTTLERLKSVQTEADAEGTLQPLFDLLADGAKESKPGVWQDRLYEAALAVASLKTRKGLERTIEKTTIRY